MPIPVPSAHQLDRPELVVGFLPRERLWAPSAPIFVCPKLVVHTKLQEPALITMGLYYRMSLLSLVPLQSPSKV